MRSCEEKEERLMLLESWRDFERDFGSEATVEKVRRLMPKKVKKRRKLTAEDGVRIFLCHFLSGAVNHFLSENWHWLCLKPRPLTSLIFSNT